MHRHRWQNPPSIMARLLSMTWAAMPHSFIFAAGSLHFPVAVCIDLLVDLDGFLHIRVRQRAFGYGTVILFLRHLAAF